jgi:hypothetical protein
LQAFLADVLLCVKVVSLRRKFAEVRAGLPGAPDLADVIAKLFLCLAPRHGLSQEKVNHSAFCD